MTLETITMQGRLVDIFPLFDRSTIQHADEIQAARFAEIQSKKRKAELPNQGFITGDLPMYVMEGKEAVLYMAHRMKNVVFDSIVEATKQISVIGSYIINYRSSIDTVIDSDTTLRIVLSNLKLNSLDDRSSYFVIDTDKYGKLNASQRKLAERIHGQGDAFKNSMDMLRKRGINTIYVRVLNPDYVKNHTPKNRANGQFSTLSGFGDGCYFDAGYRSLDDSNGHLRGLLRTGKIGAANISHFYDISKVLQDGLKTDSFAPEQIKIIRTIMEENGYRIIKGEK